MLGVAIVAIVTQILDNMLVLPLVMREQVQIHPVICLLGVLTGGIIGGVLGMILAIPAIGGIKVIWRVFTIEMKKFNLGTALYAQHYDESSKQKG